MNRPIFSSPILWYQVVFLFLLPGFRLPAQLPYLTSRYEVRTEEDILWGTAIDYAGQTDTLKLDLFKPRADNNCLRPLLLMIHGGAWVSGSRKDPEVREICRQMAQRGYVVASIDYRLGHHKTHYYVPYAVCPVDKCVYVADSSEIRRSVFRGMQDAKGALRYLASRQTQDSTDLDNVFVGGVSAGGFIALYTALLDLPEEKPGAAAILPDAPATDAELLTCYPGVLDYSRPDLGSIDGDLFTGVPLPEVRGVANFMGGLFDDLWTGPDTPAVYLYHQTNDLIVDCQVAPPLHPLYQHCIYPLNLCQSLTNLPTATGSCRLLSQFQEMGPAAPLFFNDLILNGPANGLTCLADPPTHSITNIPLRCANLANFFAPLIQISGNDPAMNCLSSSSSTPATKGLWSVFPNPCNHEFRILHPVEESGIFRMELFDISGKRVGYWRELTFPSTEPITLPDNTPPGYYWLHLTRADQRLTISFLKQ